MALFNVFSDSVLVARQQQLDSVWDGLNATITQCNYPIGVWTRFQSDYREWKLFYDSGSDWSDDSKHATDNWQTKAQDWSTEFKAMSCSGGAAWDIQPGESKDPAHDGSIPSVKDPPKDDKSALDKGFELLAKPLELVEQLGWMVAGLILLVIVAVVYMVGKGGASTRNLTISKGG